MLIRVQGSQLKAGNDLLLSAGRDIQLEAAANTQKLDGKNSSSGGAIGASIGVGSEGAGLSIFANANKGAGNEKGNGTTWTETTLDAGNEATLLSGRDTALKGAQVNAAKTCNTERGTTADSRAAFADKYGTGRHNRNAFGRCVSATAKSNGDDEGSGS